MGGGGGRKRRRRRRKKTKKKKKKGWADLVGVNAKGLKRDAAIKTHHNNLSFRLQ